MPTLKRVVTINYNVIGIRTPYFKNLRKSREQPQKYLDQDSFTIEI